MLKKILKFFKEFIHITLGVLQNRKLSLMEYVLKKLVAT